MLKFRKPKRSEYQQIADLINNADQIYHSIYSEKMFKAHYCAVESVEDLIDGEKTRKYLCAYNKNNILVGCASFRLKNNQSVWVSKFFIHSKYQNMGYGSALLNKIEKVAKKLKALVLVLETDKKAKWAVKFYKNNNYQILSDKDLKKFPFDKVLEKKQVKGRYIFGKIL